MAIFFLLGQYKFACKKSSKVLLGKSKHMERQERGGEDVTVLIVATIRVHCSHTLLGPKCILVKLSDHPFI